VPAQKLTHTGFTHPVTGLPRAGSTALEESSVDHEQYAQPLERVHGGGLHDWGVADGLQASATIGQPGVKVTPGVALDGQGRHVSLAPGGQARISQTDLSDVLPDGVTLPTAGVTGDRYLTIAWAETFDSQTYEDTFHKTFQLDHTPWLELRNVTGFTDDGTRVVLAKLTLDAAGTGNVTAIDATLRRGTALAADRLRLRRGTGGGMGAGSTETVTHRAAGELRARPAGGLELRVPDPGDEVDIGRDSGSFARLSVAAESVAARRADGTRTLTVDVANGRLGVGAGLTPLTPLHLPLAGLQVGASTTAADNFHWASDVNAGPRGLRLYNGDYGSGSMLLTVQSDGRTGVGIPAPMGRLHARDLGGFSTATGGHPEDANGVLFTSRVPLLAQADSSAFGLLNADGRAAFALNVDGNQHTSAARGIPSFYDKYDGNWHQAISLKNGQVGIGTYHPAAKLQVQGGAIMPEVGNHAGAGIYFPPNPGGGAGDEAFIRYYVAGGETTRLVMGIGNDADDALGLWQAGRERLTIWNGSVGLGVTDPGAPLEVAGPRAVAFADLREVLRLLRPVEPNVKNPNSAGLFVGSAENGIAGRSLLEFRLANEPGAQNAWGRVPDMAVLRLQARRRPSNGQLWPSVELPGTIGTNGLSAVPARNWSGGGVHTWDVEAEGTIMCAGDTISNGVVYSGRGFRTGTADVAEHYQSAEAVEPGEVVCLDRDGEEIVVSNAARDPAVLGVVSTAPGLVLSAANTTEGERDPENAVPVALCGRVPCKVTAENGPIRRGDTLTTSSTRGHAMRAASADGTTGDRPPAGTVIGKALGSLDAGAGTIDVLVALG
jgi:hypothetical protein